MTADRLQSFAKPVAYSNFCRLLIPDTGAVTSEFAALWLDWMYVSGVLPSWRATSAMPNLDLKGFLAGQMMMIPPRDEQRRIVDLISSLDATITATDQAIAKAEQARRAIRTDLLAPPTPAARSAATDDPPRVATPEGWIQATIGEVATVVGGGTPRTSETSYWGGPIPWITPTEVVASEGTSVTTTARTITQLGLQNSGAQLLPPSSVLVTSRATVGAVAMTGCPMATNQGFAALIAGPLVLPAFLMIWCQANAGEFRMRAGGSTFPEVSRTVVREIPIVLPPLDTQRRIVDIVSVLNDEVDALSATAAAGRKTRRGLLSELLFGTHEIPSSYDRFLDAA